MTSSAFLVLECSPQRLSGTEAGKRMICDSFKCAVMCWEAVHSDKTLKKGVVIIRPSDLWENQIRSVNFDNVTRICKLAEEMEFSKLGIGSQL